MTRSPLQSAPVLTLLYRRPQESGVAYSVRLNNGERVRVVVYVVSDDPKAVVVPGAPIEQRYQWNSVTRSQCKKGCSGPILRAIQRFGRQGRCAGPR